MTTGTIVVTGGTGAIGRLLIERALQRGLNVRALARHVPDERDARIDWFQGNLEGLGATFSDALRGADAVVHLAAKIDSGARGSEAERELWQVNVLGTRSLVESMQDTGVRRLVLASTANLYRPDLDEANEASPVEPRSRVLYLASKAAQEWIARSMCAGSSISCAIMRISSVIGAGSSVVDSMARRLCEGQGVKLNDAGRFGADFVLADDVVSGLLIAIEQDLQGIFNLASGKRTLLADIAFKLALLTGRGPDAVEVLPPQPRPDAGFPAINCDRLRAYGYDPISLDDALGLIVRNTQALSGAAG